MGLFDQYNHQSPKHPVQDQQMSIQQAQQAFQSDLANLKADPVAYAKAHGKTLPEGITDPNQMVQYLLKSTQVNNPRYQAAMKILGGLFGKQ